MTEENLQKLRKLKNDLLKKAVDLKNQLKKREENEFQAQHLSHIILPEAEETTDISKNTYNEYNERLCEAMRHVTGVKFENTEKTWLQDDVYIYKTNVITKAIHFILELQVRVKDDDVTETIDITCHFVNVEPCYMLEVAPWIQLLTRMKNFSYFLTAISDYSDYSISRSKILHQVEKNDFATLKEHLEDTGGILAYIHPPGSNNVYLKFLWAVKFSEQTWHIEHFLTIIPTDIGKEFAEKNSDLLSGFCKLGLKHNDLEGLFTQLTDVLPEYRKNP